MSLRSFKSINSKGLDNNNNKVADFLFKLSQNWDKLIKRAILFYENSYYELSSLTVIT